MKKIKLVRQDKKVANCYFCIYLYNSKNMKKIKISDKIFKQLIKMNLEKTIFR